MRQIDSATGVGSRHGERQFFVSATARIWCSKNAEARTEWGWGGSWPCKCHSHSPSWGLSIQLGLLACSQRLLHQDNKGGFLCVCALNVNKPQFSTQIHSEANDLCYQQFQLVWLSNEKCKIRGGGIWVHAFHWKSWLGEVRNSSTQVEIMDQVH